MSDDGRNWKHVLVGWAIIAALIGAFVAGHALGWGEGRGECAGLSREDYAGCRELERLRDAEFQRDY